MFTFSFGLGIEKSSRSVKPHSLQKQHKYYPCLVEILAGKHAVLIGRFFEKQIKNFLKEEHNCRQADFLIFLTRSFRKSIGQFY